MSKVQPVSRPGAVPRRPGAAPSVTPSSGGQRQGPSLDELRALPSFVDDDNADAVVDPDNASSGKMMEETATIVSAKFAIQDWKRKDGSYPETSYPEVQLQLFFQRDGDDAGDRPYQENYRYGMVGYFAPTKDGNNVKVRPGIVKEGGYVPAPRKTEPAMLFIQSLKDAGGKNITDKLKTEGAKALAGVRVHVRSRKVAGQSEKAKPVLLVDYIEGVTAPVAVNPNAATSGQAPALARAKDQTVSQPDPTRETVVTPNPVPAQSATAEPASEIDSLAELALCDILDQSESGSIVRATIPTTLIRLEQWKSHENRGAILKTLRDDAFINRQTSWTVNGNVVSKK